MKPKKSHKSLWLGLATLVFLIVTIVMNVVMRNQEVDYELVKAIVISSETKHVKIKGTSYEEYEVYVSYDGVDYKLKNAHDSYSYQPGRTTDAYFSHGKMYANVEGIKTSGPIGIAYFGSMFATFLLLVVWLVSLSKKKNPA